MNVHRLLPWSTKRRRAWLHVVAVLVALIALVPRASTARADTLCYLGAGCPSTYPPPALLDLNQPEYPLYDATPAQTTSLQKLENQAVSNVISEHGLAAADADAVQSWARTDAEAELYKLLLQAINTSAASRTADQQNAVDWLTAVMQRQAVTAAQDAALEYVKWAGLDQSQYQSLLNSNASESDLASFLSGQPDNYNNPDPSKATGGWCVYRSPAPYGNEYTGYNDVTCTNQCPFLCNPPTPSYDQFTKWGEADADYPLLNTGDYQSAAQSIALGLGLGTSLGAIYTTGALGSYFAAAGASIAASWASVGETSESALSIAVGGFGLGGFATVTFVVAALVTAIIEGITVTNAAKLPGQLASLISGAETTAPDPATLLSSSSGGATIYSLFVGATLPAPVNRACDNGALAQLGPWGWYPITINGVTTLSGNTVCLNPTAIPTADPTDPQFLVRAKGATTQTSSPTITWKDAASGATTTARLSENWFIENESVQTLHITYTDWNGNEQTAWLLGDPTDGYTFLNFSAPADSSTTVDPTTCVANGICSSGTSIDYVGSDGQDYSASVQPYQPPTGSPTYSTPVEASPITFNANNFAPGGAVSPITYTWQFQYSTILDQTTDTYIPSYTQPVSGATATYTWQSGGWESVILTATDADGVQANDTFTVNVGDVPPTVQLSPLCSSAPLPEGDCNPGFTGDVGTSMALSARITHAGSQDSEYATVNWGDGSAPDGGGPGLRYVQGNWLTLTPTDDHTIIVSGSHTYAKPGTYTGTIWAYDLDGGSTSVNFTETIVAQQQSISFSSIPTHTYGDAPFTISATGGGSGQPVTFAVTGSASVCTVAAATSGVDGSGNGTGSATVTVLTPGTCAITASQAGGGGYQAAQNVTQSFTVQPAPLTVTAASPSITYGGTVPAITPSYSGFVSTDTSSSLTTQATCSVASNTGAAGTYQTTCSGATDPNYSFTYKPGTLTIKQAPLTITANDKTMTYGADVPAFDAGYSGFVNGDTSSVVSGLTCGAVDGSNQPVSGSTPAGQYQIICSGGTAANYALTYQPGTLTIARANTSVTLAAAPAPSLFGQPVTITASVAVKSPGAGHPGGTVAFKDGGTDIGGCSAQPVSTTTETATCTTSSLSVATHSVTASYSGDSNFNGSSTAAALTQTVNKAASAVTLAPTTPSTQGQPATFTAMVAATAPGAGTPAGTVTFKDGSTTLGTGQLSVVGGKDQATFSTSGLGVGPHTITAGYGGDGSFVTSTSAALTQYVNTNLSGYPKLASGAYNLSNANLSGGYFVNAPLAGASLSGSNLKGAVFTGADLTGANLSNSNFMGSANFTNATLANANLSNSNFKGDTFTGANLSGANLTNSNLMGATGLRTATLTNVVWSNTACPDGTASNNDGGTCAGHL